MIELEAIFQFNSPQGNTANAVFQNNICDCFNNRKKNHAFAVLIFILFIPVLKVANNNIY